MKRTELAALLSDSRLSNGKVSQASASTLTCSRADPGLLRIPMAVPQGSLPSSPEVLDKEGIIWPLRDNFAGVPLPAGREISGPLLTFSSRQSTCLVWTKPWVPLPAACTTHKSQLSTAPRTGFTTKNYLFSGPREMAHQLRTLGSSREPRFNSLHSHGSSQLSVTSSRGPGTPEQTYR